MTKQELDNLIIENIHTNDAGLITGLILQQVLLYLADYSANKSELMSLFLSKLNDDTAQGMITLMGGGRFGNYVPGMFNGTGAQIDEFGRGELESLAVRSFLEVPELRYNRLTLIGEEIAVGAGGIVEKVITLLDPTQFILIMKLEDGELIPFQAHDIVKGIFKQIIGPDLKGIRTSWFRVIDVDQAEHTMLIVLGNDVAVPAGINFPPQPSMNIARVGNFINKTRQSSIFLSAKDGNIIMLDGVDNYMAGIRSFQLGRLAGLEQIIDLTKLTQLDPNASYLYAKGILVEQIIKVDYKGIPQKEIRDRGDWSLDVAMGDDPYRYTEILQDAVWMPDGRYVCIVDKTQQKPHKLATDWVQSVTIYSEDYTKQSTTFFARPSVYKKGDVWILEADIMLEGMQYFKGEILHAVYETGTDIDWRRVHLGDETKTTDGINLVRNYDFRYGLTHWGGVGELGELEPSEELPTEFYDPVIPVIGDEYGYGLALTINGAKIRFDR